MKTTTKAIGLALTVALGSQTVSAATRTVTNLNDSGPGSLRDTILASGPGDTIYFFSGGTIVLTRGELAIGRSLTIVGPAGGVTVSANNNNRVFNIISGDVILSNVVVSSGRMVGDSGGGSASGGGVLNNGNLGLINCRLHANEVVGGQGRMFPAIQSGGSASGGAICNFGNLTLLNCTLDSNSVRGGAGADIDTGGHGGNAYGGAICNFGRSVTLLNCTLDSNSATGGAGSGSQSLNGGSAYGGAVYSAGMVSLVSCTLNRGSASGGKGGAGIGSFGGSAGGNADGGGLFHGDTATIHNTVLSSCSVLAGLGGPGVFPIDPSGPNGSATGPDVAGAVSSLGHNLVGEADGSSGWMASDLTGTVATPLDPQLGPLQNNGGPVPTMALLPVSVAIDAGDDAVLSPPYSLATDARGLARRTSDHVDIGAYEFSTITRLVTTTSDSGGGSLRNAIGLASPFDRILFARIVRGTIRLTSGELLINQPLSIVGPGAAVLAISGNTNSRVFHIGPQGDVEIHGLTVTEGCVVEANGTDATLFSAGTPGGYAKGGGVFNEGILRIFDSMIVSNSVQGGRGGGGYVNTIFPANTRYRGENGGPAVGSGIYSAGQIKVHRCTLIGNRALGGPGGMGGDSLNPANATAAGTGGYASGAGAYAASAEFEGCTVAANLSTGGQGGRGAQAGQVFRVGGPGGPAAGGGLSGGLALINCSVSGNSVTGGMGGTGSVAGVIGETYAGGVNAVQLSVQSTIVAGNTGSAGSPDVLGTVTSQGWNLIGITDGSGGWTTDDLLGNSSFPLDALLSACQDNGGPVWTMCPLANSPARDAGRSVLATDTRGGPRVVDFRNVPNAAGGDGSDIGALEVDSLFGPITIDKSDSFARVRFKSDPGTTYRLQQTSAVGDRVWTDIGGTIMAGDGHMLEATDFAPLPANRFYRVRAD